MSRIDSQTRWQSASSRSDSIPGLRVFDFIGRLAAGIGVLLVVAVVGFLLVVRLRQRQLLYRVRGFNQRFLNPLVLSFAGREGSGGYAIIRHTGRRTGRPYATPIVAQPTADGFVIALPYGADVDWLRNVRAAGTCQIQRNGIAYTCGEPELIGQEVALALIPERVRGIWQFLEIRQFLKLKQVAAVPAESAPS